MSDLWIIYCVVFAAVILAVQPLYRLIVGAQRRGATLKRRLALSAGRAAGEPVEMPDEPHPGALRLEGNDLEF